MSADPNPATQSHDQSPIWQKRVAELEANLAQHTARLAALHVELQQTIHERQQLEESLLRAEQRYRVTFESASDAVFILNMAGRFIEANPTACVQLGFAPADLLQKYLPEVVTLEQREAIHRRLEVLHHQNELAFDTTFQQPTGSVLQVELNCRVIDYGGFPVIFCMAHDLTERKRTEIRLLQTEKMSALGRLVSTIAHEINNPLQAVEGCLVLAQREVEEGSILDEEHAAALLQDLEVATTEVARIARLVDRLHDFYRPTRPGVQPIEADAAIEAVLALVTRQLWYGNITVVHQPSDPPLQLMTNADQLKQVLLNLVLNAVDAMPQGGTLSLSARLGTLLRNGQAQPSVSIEVSDTGVGISQAHLPHLFEPFFTTKENGSGLGLSISYELIKALGGEMNVSSQVGLGTTFTIHLPLGVETPTVGELL